LFGAIIKLNPKRAKIQTRQGVWAVPYSMLFTIIDGEQARDKFIPAKLELFTDSCINPAPDDDTIPR
jgi:hypothetical protein